MSKLSWREERTMQAFEELPVLRYCDLPYCVGSKTMDALIDKGLVELVDKYVGKYAKARCWRRTRKRK